MRKLLILSTLSWILGLAPLAAAPTPTPTPKGFEGEIDYDLFYTSYEPVIHMRYLIKGTRVRMDWVDVDETAGVWGDNPKVRESAFVDMADGKMWSEERQKKLHFDSVAAPEKVEISKTSVLKSDFSASLAGDDFGKSVKAYEETYGYSVTAVAKSAPAKALDKEGFKLNLWTAGEEKTLTTPGPHPRKIKAAANEALKNSPFPLLLQMSRKPGKHSMAMAGPMMMDAHHNFICMYAVKIRPKTLSESVFKPKNYAVRDSSGLFAGKELFNQGVTLAQPTPAGKGGKK